MDEDDVRVRPGKSSRPRTRQRPAHESAIAGFVTSVDRGRYGCIADGRLVVAMKARELGKGSVVVGDRVALAGDTTGAEGSLARIVRVEPRTSALRRSPDDTDPAERVIVANADQLVIVSALASPEPHLRFIDRCLVAAYDAGLDPLLLLTKADLAPSSEVRRIRAFYTPLGLPMLTTRRPLAAQTLTRVRNALTGRISVLIGQSGVGKSTMVNTLVPEAARSVGLVNPVTGRGRHTSSSAVALPLGDGWLIDTPGLRGFGLGHVSPERVAEAFGDLAEGTVDCPAGCDHLSPGCALDQWAREHHAEARLDSLRRLLRSRDGTGADDLTGFARREVGPEGPQVLPERRFGLGDGGVAGRVYAAARQRQRLLGAGRPDVVPGARIGVQHVLPAVVVPVQPGQDGPGVRARGPGLIGLAAVQEHRAVDLLGPAAASWRSPGSSRRRRGCRWRRRCRCG
jgi:ribosome biogenesis GTPase / thiamine phosphate phosphatase